MGVVAGLYMCDVVKKKFTFAISSPDEFLYIYAVQVSRINCLKVGLDSGP